MSALLIDFHTHPVPHTQITPSFERMMLDIMGSKEKLAVHNAYYANSDNFIAEIRANGLDYAVVLASYTPLNSGITSNEAVERYCLGHEELIPFCSFNPHTEPNMPASLRLLCGRGFKGLKLYPSYNQFYINEARMYPLYEEAQSLNMPLLVHTGTSIFENTRLKYARPLSIDDVAVDFSKLNILMAHGGRTAWYDEAMMVARMHSNVYIDISGIPVKKLKSIFPDMERFAHKFVMGTDWPQIKAQKSIAEIRSLGFSQEAEALILGGNAARILHISTA